MAESTRASMSAKGILTNTVCISSCRPFRNLFFFLASVSISSGAYLAQKFVTVFHYSHPSLLQLSELVSHSLDQTRWHMGSAKLDLEFLPGHHLASGHCANTVPPCSGISG